MNPFDIQLKSLVKCLSALKIRYVLLGGVAVSIYGEPRMTADIDVNIILDKKRIVDFLKRARKYGFYPALPKTEDIAKKTGVIPVNFKKGKVTGFFDLIIAENILEYTAIERGSTKNIGSVKARLISPEDLVLHKITSSRPRDLEDLKGVLIRQKGKLDTRYIRYWLKKIDKVNSGCCLYRLFEKLA